MYTGYKSSQLCLTAEWQHSCNNLDIYRSAHGEKQDKTPYLVLLVCLVGRKVPSRSPALFTVVDKCVLSVAIVTLIIKPKRRKLTLKCGQI